MAPLHPSGSLHLSRTPLFRRVVATVGLTAVVATLGTVVATTASAAPGHTTIVASLPGNKTPNVLDGEVDAIYDTGSKIILGGTFTQAQNHNDTSTTYSRNYILMFDKTTGLIDTSFTPVLNNPVYSIIAGPTAGTVYIGGQFNTVNGTNRRKLAEIDTSTGALVTAFGNVALNATVFDLAVAQGHLIATGIFTTAGTNTRNGLVSLNPTTGAVDTYLTTALTGHHNFNGVSGANAGVGGTKMAVLPDSSAMWVIGNFKQADGVTHDQIAKIILGTTTAGLDTTWNTTSFQYSCNSGAFDSWVRSISVSPDGAYFAVASTGGPYGNTVLCDSTSRWETNSTGATVVPTWIDWAGGDTIVSVVVSEKAVYVGGHFRWLNNSFGGDNSQAGAIGRASIAALDPLSGTPLSWNPGRNPRGFGITAMIVTPDGLWVGSDTDYLGNFQYLRQRIGFFPLAGGLATASTTVATLPGNVYFAGPRDTSVLYRINTGGSTIAAVDAGPDWSADNSDPSPYRNNGSNFAGYGLIGTVNASVPSSTPPDIFSSERWDPSDATEAQWTFPVTSGKHIAVKLYFANRYSGTSGVGQRVFDVTLDGTLVLNHYDIVADAGDQTGTMKEFDITSDGTVNIDFGHVTENPLVNGIEIVDLDAVGGQSPDAITDRTYDGTNTVGATATVSDPSATTWSNTRGAFWVGGTLFYGWSDGKLYERTFNGTTWGTPSLVDPYHDAYWDTIGTGSGSSVYAGVTTNFYSQITTVTGMFYDGGGRLYYTRGTQSNLYWRWFNPDNGAIGPDEHAVSGSTGFGDSGGVFISGGNLYTVSRASGDLTKQTFTGGVPGGSAATVSGPGVDGVDWRAKGVFVGP